RWSALTWAEWPAAARMRSTRPTAVRPATAGERRTRIAGRLTARDEPVLNGGLGGDDDEPAAGMQHLAPAELGRELVGIEEALVDPVAGAVVELALLPLLARVARRVDDEQLVADAAGLRQEPAPLVPGAVARGEQPPAQPPVVVLLGPRVVVRAVGRVHYPAGEYRRASVSATHTGFSPPSRSKVAVVVIWMPPGISSTAVSVARMRTFV